MLLVRGVAVRTRSVRRAPSGTPSGLLALLAGDVDHPGHAEPVGAHPELVAPNLLLQLHHDVAAIGELLPVAAEHLVVVSAEADGVVAAGGELLARRVVGA